MFDMRTFDRTEDVSKLEGCNTRNVEYRWDLFSKELEMIPRGSETLDFGAGSLRDSFELAKRGYNVTSVDLDPDILSSYQADYDWPTNGTKRRIVTGQDLAECLSQIENTHFSLIISFDVLEHLEDPTTVFRKLRPLLTPNGRFFITVPNGRTLFELWFKLIVIASRIFGKKLRPGEPHLQRNSPEWWKEILSEAGYQVLAHEMQIGFFVNTASALVQIPLYSFGRLVRVLGFNFPADKIQNIVCSKKAMASLNKIDEKTRRYFSGLYGWNLFVVTPSSE
jgi:2-polyprenyl-3-methyl-5-hydroxy-6-metoxy-1,4-benzoquinol methylase